MSGPERLPLPPLRPTGPSGPPMGMLGSRSGRFDRGRSSLLVPGGSILICDHVNSSSPAGHRAAHFMTVEEHLATFEEIGFIRPREICPAADLSLMGAEKP